MSEPQARIASLHVYPIKGCRGLDLARVTLTATGLEWDRNWMFVDANARFLSQREVPGLARVEPRIEDGALLLAARGHAPLRCPLQIGGEEVRVTVWRDTCTALASAVDTREWLQRVTGTPGQLVRGLPHHVRVSDVAYTGTERGTHYFADAYAVLLAGAASLADLNGRLREPLPMSRFRPNLVIEGLEAFAEDRLQWLRCGEVALKCVKPSTRCIVTTTDQVTGERRGEEPLRTLRSFRWTRALKGVAFGMNAIVVSGAGTQLAVGDRLAVEWRAVDPSTESGLGASSA